MGLVSVRLMPDGRLVRERDGVVETLVPRVDLARMELFRPRLAGHRRGAQAARAAGESCSSRMAVGGREPCRSMSQVVL